MKYNIEQLKKMAKHLIYCKKNNYFSYLEFIIAVSTYTSTTPEYVEKKIHDYANS